MTGKDNYLENTSLVPCNILQGVSKQIGVVQVQGGNAARDRSVDDICTVILATDSNLYQSNINFLLSENVKCHHCQKAKVVWHQALIIILQKIST